MIIEQTGDLMDWWRQGNLIGITTNGFVKKNGRAVMGAGIAKSIRDACPDLDLELGVRLRAHGNIPMVFPDHHIFTYPVKHNWWEEADIDLIAESGRYIAARFYEGGAARIDIPRPGCGNGKLNWADVKPVLEEIFVHTPTYVWTFE